MKTAILIFGLILSLAAVSFGQTRNVTNATLERYQQKRLAAERDYRENYARLGFPSPEELERQRETDLAARLELAEQLRQARLEKERLELERRNLELDALRLERETVVESIDGFGGIYFGGSGGFFSDGRFGRFGHRRNRFFPFRGTGGVRITPVGVFPTGGTRPRPFIRRGGRISGPRSHGPRR